MAELTTEERNKQDDERRKLLLALFLLLVSDTHEHLVKQSTAYLAGTMSIHALSRAVTTLLLGAHTHAVWMGRRLGGASAPLDETDMLFAKTVMAGQAAFLTGLLNDLSTGRYPLVDGAVNPDLSRRLLWYANRLRGTADEAWVLSLPPETELNWITTAAESCGDCKEMEATSPHSGATLDKYPGSGQTECVMNCRCYLETTDGRRGFTL